MAATETSTRATAAVDDLYRHHVGDVYRYSYAVLGNHADAEDVTQTTFVNALRALERGDAPRNPSSWLIAIAQNVVRQRWRQAAARPTEVELVQDVPDTPADDDIELDELVRALQRIPPAQREALVLRELEGRSYNEISELLGLSTSALETLLFRARRSLAEELENIVTCQSAELAMSKQLDGRLPRKEKRRLDEHLAECPDCARLAETQKRQRRAFKGLAVLPIPIGLAFFKGAPSASAAASLPTIGLGATGTGTNGVGAAGATGVGGAAGAGGMAVEGSLVAVAAKVAAVIVAAAVATGVAYKGIQIALDSSGPPVAAKAKRDAPRAGVAGALAAGAATRPNAPPTRTGTTSPGKAAAGASSSVGQAGAPGDRSAGEAGAATHQADGRSSGAPPTGGRSGSPGQAPGAGGGSPSGPAAGTGSGQGSAAGNTAAAGNGPAAGTGAAAGPGATASVTPKPTPVKPKKAKARNPKAAPRPKPPKTAPKPKPPTAGPKPKPAPPANGNPSNPGAGQGSGSGESSGNGNGNQSGNGQPGGSSQPSVSTTQTGSSGSSTSSGSTSSSDGSTTGGGTSEGTATGGDSSSSASPGCPGGGNGPGDGKGCGIGNGNGQDMGKP